VSRLLPVILLAMFPFIAADVIAPPGLNWILAGGHLLLLYAAALLCHARLAASRPSSEHLTEFYLWIAIGGVLGGVFTAAAAPLVFRTVAEYPILVAAVAFFRRPADKAYRSTDSDWLYPGLVAAGITVVWIVFRKTNIAADVTVPALVHTTLLVAAYRFRARPLRFALTLTILMIAYNIVLPHYVEGATRVFVARNFFGVKKVLQSGSFRSLLHGDTTHGAENELHPGDPTSYYHPAGSVGDVMLRLGRPINRIAVIGLGTGSMAGYITPGRNMTFFEIDPQVAEIAHTFFGFLTKCGPSCSVVIGDGRMELQRLPDHGFDLLMVDAFSSDAIPTHLASQEALQIYLRKLSSDGILLFHASNRYLNMQRLAEQLVLDAGLVAFQRSDESGALAKEGKSGTNHVIAAHRLEDLGQLPQLAAWKRVTQPPGIPVWTDDYSSLVDLIRWH